MDGNLVKPLVKPKHDDYGRSNNNNNKSIISQGLGNTNFGSVGFADFWNWCDRHSHTLHVLPFSCRLGGSYLMAFDVLMNEKHFVMLVAAGLA